MPLQAPNLDDRTFAQIVSEAKTLIPRYAPEWTDHNESDPGITLVQLFAWMTEMLLYRVNRIPDRNYIAFLRLLGIELLPARPASAELTFTLARKDTVNVPMKSTVRLLVHFDERPGEWMIHCHILDHADGGLMGTVLVGDGKASTHTHKSQHE